MCHPSREESYVDDKAVDTIRSPRFLSYDATLFHRTVLFLLPGVRISNRYSPSSCSSRAGWNNERLPLGVEHAKKVLVSCIMAAPNNPAWFVRRHAYLMSIVVHPTEEKKSAD